MTRALRITVGNGQSYENCDVLTPAEMAEAGVVALFGPHTFCYRVRAVHKLCHAHTINVIHLSRLAPRHPDAIPFEQLVLRDDTSYSPGFLLPRVVWQEVGIPDILPACEQIQPLAFTCQQGLLIVPDCSVAVLECRAITPAPRSPRANG